VCDVWITATSLFWPADRLKVTLASGYYTARLAVSCSLFRDAYESVTYGGKTMLHWCEREVKWASDWLLKTYVPGAGTPVGKWGPKDQFVAMVSIMTTPSYFACAWAVCSNRPCTCSLAQLVPISRAQNAP
jgi:hypothetical protein